jgi:hypothetical protein
MNESRLSRRAWLGVVAGGAAAALISRPVFALAAGAADAATAPKVKITVYKSAACGCCTKWVDHMNASGFVVDAKDVEDLDAIKRTMGVPASLQSCHTGIVGRYVVEGHVPADVVQKMLREKPAIAGIAVPGMPAGSPGMEMGARKDRYDIVAFRANGSTSVFAKR